MKILIEVSARHIHLSRRDCEAIFGKGYELKKKADLYQPGDFACEETLEIVNNDKKLSARIVGPLRKETQVELSKTDAFYLGIEAPVRLSGDLKGTPGIEVEGPNGKIKLEKGVIIAQRHIHCNKEEAKELKQGLSVKVEGERELIFNNVPIRISDEYKLAIHVDTDEGNASGINKKAYGIII